MVLEKTLESPLDCEEINPKGNQPWIFIGRTDNEAEAPILWPSDVKSWVIGKDPDAGKDWGKKEKRAAEDEMDRWHQWTWIWANSREIVKDREACAAFHGVTKSRKWLSYWTTTNPIWPVSLEEEETPRVLEYSEKTMWGLWEKVAVCKPRGEAWEETSPTDTLILYSQLPELWDSRFLLFKPADWWYFDTYMWVWYIHIHAYTYVHFFLNHLWVNYMSFITHKYGHCVFPKNKDILLPDHRMMMNIRKLTSLQ